jgi:hypothetical protein
MSCWLSQYDSVISITVGTQIIFGARRADGIYSSSRTVGNQAKIGPDLCGGDGNCLYRKLLQFKYITNCS